MIFYHLKNMLELPQSFSPFIELQYCKTKQGKKLKKLVSVHSMIFKQEDSLYISSNDMYKFFNSYSDIFQNGVYNNLKTGNIDLFGINYYSSIHLKEIILRVEQAKPVDYIILLEWLKHGIDYNGFYILGI